VHELASAPKPDEDGVLKCPDCGSSVRLALVSTVDRGLHHRSAPRAVPDPVEGSASLPDFEQSVKRYKRDLIARALDENDGVMTRAAKALGLKYTTFVAMVHRLEMGPREDDRDSDNDS
jgi:transcriptional regulator with GAF, ATPase, and Fis domain